MHGMSLEQVEAAAAREGSKKGKRVPRELRGLAMPDRDWNVAMPFFTVASKTREQFYTSANPQQAAAAAREAHSQRAAEAAAEAEEAEAEAAKAAAPEAVQGAGVSGGAEAATPAP